MKVTNFIIRPFNQNNIATTFSYLDLIINQYIYFCYSPVYCICIQYKMYNINGPRLISSVNFFVVKVRVSVLFLSLLKWKEAIRKREVIGRKYWFKYWETGIQIKACMFVLKYHNIKFSFQQLNEDKTHTYVHICINGFVCIIYMVK